MAKLMRKRIYEIIEVAKPGDRSSRIYDCFMLACIVCSIVPLCFKTTNAAFLWADKITVGIYIADYALRWITADYKYPNSKYAWLRYPFSFFAIVDLLSILPSITPLVLYKPRK